MWEVAFTLLVDDDQQDYHRTASPWTGELLEKFDLYPVLEEPPLSLGSQIQART